MQAASEATMEATVKPAWYAPVPGEEELVQRHIGLVHAVLRREFSGVQIEYDDALQIGMTGLLQAVRTYDPDKGCSLPTHAMLCIRNALLSALKRQRAKRRKAPSPLVSLDAPRSDEDDRPLEIADARQDTEREALARVRVQRLLGRLCPRDRQFVELLMAGETVSVIAGKTGLAEHVVRTRIEKMRRIIEEENPVSKPDENAGVKNSLADMNAFLFAQMKRLSNEELTGDALKEEVMRSKALADVATRIIQSGELVLRAHTFGDRQVDKSSKLPQLLSGDE